MIKKLVTIPDETLRIKSRKIGYVDDSIKKLAEDMIETTLDWDHDSEFGAALAAIQVGEPIQLTVVRDKFESSKDKTFSTFVNPKIIKKSQQTVTDVEGCLSVPGLYGRVKRALKIKVRAQDLDGNEIRLNLEGFPARVLQHEIDHMNGIIFLDHIKSNKDLMSIDASGKLNPLNDEESK